MTRWNANTRWSVDDAKEIERAVSQMGDYVEEAFRKIVPEGVEETAGTWKGVLHRRLSLYDRCEVVVTLTGEPDDIRSKVAVSIVFDASASRVEALMMSTTSLVGIPFGWGWRIQSLASSKRVARQLLETFWASLLPRLEQTAYR
jgi:hypothetical protein